MDIEAIVKKHAGEWGEYTQLAVESSIRAALTELAAGYEKERKNTAHQIDACMRDNVSLRQRIRQIEAERVPEAAIKLLDDVIFAMTEGFVRCDNCGEQQDTKDLDFMSELTELRAMLAASPAQKKKEPRHG